MPDLRIVDVTVGRRTVEIELDTGRTVSIPHTERMRDATPSQRRFKIVDDGAGVWWPETDEDLRVAEIEEAMLDVRRFCGERNRWNAERCESCERERWNDPDDTELGRQLGEIERVDLEAARAAEDLRRMTSRTSRARARPRRDDS